MYCRQCYDTKLVYDCIVRRSKHEWDVYRDAQDDAVNDESSHGRDPTEAYVTVQCSRQMLLLLGQTEGVARMSPPETYRHATAARPPRDKQT